MRLAVLAFALLLPACLSECGAVGGGVIGRGSSGGDGAAGRGVMSPPRGGACLTDMSATPTTLFDADDIDGSSNSTVSDNDKVATWVDTGDGVDATNMVNATSAEQPLAVEDCVNGQWCVSSDATDQLLGDTSHLAYLHKAAGHTCYAVFRKAGDGNNIAGLLQTASTTNNDGVLFRFDERDGTRDRSLGLRHTKSSNHINLWSSEAAYTHGSWGLAVFRAGTAAGDDADTRMDGTSVASAEAGTYSTASVSSASSLLFGDYGFDHYVGDLAYLACYDSRQSDATVAANEAALSCRYGLGLSASTWTPASPDSMVAHFCPGSGDCKVALVGDSITDGQGATTAPVDLLDTELGAGYAVSEYAVGGARTDAITEQYMASVRGAGFHLLVMMGGTNDVRTDDAAGGGTWEDLARGASMAAGDGLGVLLLAETGFANAASHTAARQTEYDLLNTKLLAYAPNNVKVHDLYTEMEDDITTDALEADYDSGDGVHPNQDGYDLIASITARELTE